MTIREIIEKAAREAAHGYHDQSAAKHGVIHPLRDHIAAALLAILTDPEIGFKEALETSRYGDCGCAKCEAKSEAIHEKLKQLEELSK